MCGQEFARCQCSWPDLKIMLLVQHMTTPSAQFALPHQAGQESPWGTYKPSGVAALGIAVTRSPFARGPIYRAVRRLVSRIQPTYDIVVDGIKFRCTINDNATEMGLVFNGHRQERQGRHALLKDVVPGNVVVDIGANCGTYSLFSARAVGSAGKVIAIEPLPVMVKRLKFNIAVNGFRNIHVFAEAVGAAEDMQELYLDGSQLGLSTMRPQAGLTALRVPISPLDSIVAKAEVRQIDRLKIDVEGYEDRVLLPFIETAPKALWPKRIFMETLWSDRWELDCVGELRKAGYREIWREKPDILLAL